MVGKKDKRAYIKGKKKDIHKKDKNHLMNARKQALELAKKNRNWIKINCLKNGKMMSAEDVGDLIWEKIEAYF